MPTIDAELLFVPDREALRFLPEGPYRCGPRQLSWVAIQHGADSSTGSLNVLDLTSGENQNFALPGRPGFAFPTTTAGQFVIGLERAVVVFDTSDGRTEVLAEGIDANVNGTIINDGVVFDGQLLFGCKDLKFAEKKAGLYLLRAADGALLQLAADQVCSNGKAIQQASDGSYTLYDIDTPSKQVIAWQLDLEAGQITDPRVVVDMTEGDVFPDGMIMTPDGQGLIIAFYDPRDSDHGEARWYDIATGAVQTIWRCPKSPRVTCPQLIEQGGKIRLVLTTADEGMPAEMRNKAVNAGCLFVAETDFQALNDAPKFSKLV